MAVCNMDCFNCPFEDCIADDITLEEIVSTNIMDTDIKRSRLDGRNLTIFNYNHSEKGIESRKRYEEKRKGVRKRSGTQIPYECRKEYFKSRYLKKKQEQAIKSC